MKLRNLAMLAALGLAPAAFAQAPAPNPNIPRPCTNCHQPKADELFANLEGVAFKSQSMQLKVDARTEIVRFDASSLLEP